MSDLASRLFIRSISGAPDRWRRLLFTTVCAYAAAAAVVLELAAGQVRVSHELSNWIAFPLQIVTIVLTGRLGWRMRSRPGSDRWLWPLVCVFSIQNLAATCIWNLWRPTGMGPLFSFADVQYLADYWMMTGVYAVLLNRYGSSFRRRRFWVDGVAIFTTLLAAFWVVLLSPMPPPASSHQPGLMFTLPYALTLVPMMTMAALVWISLPDIRRHPVDVLLIAAGLAEAVWEITWLASWRTNTDFIGAYYNFGDVLCFGSILIAVGATRNLPESSLEPVSGVRSADTFLPTLATLLTLALIAGTLASTRATDTWILVGLVILSAFLLVTRHSAVTREISALNRALAVHEADARLTELARQSTDLFLVIDTQGVIVFASAAAETIIGIPASQLVGDSPLSLFGALHRNALSAYLTALAGKDDALGPIELSYAAGGQTTRALKISGANRLKNRYIQGVTLTVSDVTEQRAMEREVLDAANQERLRLASDLHDGLGQELTGISMLLQSAASSPAADPAQQSAFLKTIVGHMRKAIHGSRDLAHGLSPIYVVRGSLGGALQRLCQDGDGSRKVQVRVDPEFDDSVIGDFPADHLYRIAREAVRNALTHSQCTNVEVTLRIQAGQLLMVISDDGSGFEQRAQRGRALGLRLMEYRTRVIGGVLKILSGSGAGTQVHLCVPIENILRQSKSA